ncbi:MAG: class I SAM-dependent methyltransferase [Nanoarchaeota archaeon]
MVNAWEKYYQERKTNYFGETISDASDIIKILDIKESDIVLDIGAGPGAHLEYMRQKIPNVKCMGIEISPTAIKKKLSKELDIRLGDMRKMPFRNESVNKVFSLGTVEHVPDTLQVLREIYRVTKSGGKIYLTIPNKISFFHITKNFKMLIGKWDIGYEASFSPRQFRKLLHKVGFKNAKYFIMPHPRVNNIFNYMDNRLNKFKGKYFGFFLHFVAEKNSLENSSQKEER